MKKAKETKTKKPNTKVKRNKQLVVEEIIDLLSLQPRPITRKFIERISYEIVKWAKEDPDALVMLKFYADHGFSDRDAQRWAKKFPIWQRARNAAKSYISARRQIGMLKRKYSERGVMVSLPVYGESWEFGEDYSKLKEWESGLRTKEEEKGPQTFVINMPSFEEMKKIGD